MYKLFEVRTSKDIKDFLNLPLRLYKDNEYYVPELYGDVKKLFSKKNPHLNVCDQVFFIVRDTSNNEVVGRIQGIIQKTYNEIHKEKRARFCRIHFINDLEVVSLLTKAVEDWAKEKGMDTVCGPLNYTDLEREGLLVEGFDEKQTFEEEYNFSYYGELLEKCGYQKEVDWLEFRLNLPDDNNAKLKLVAKRALEWSHLHVVDSSNMSKRKYFKKYLPDFFSLLDTCYAKLYGVVPISDKERKSFLKGFYLIINKSFLKYIADENDHIVAMGLGIPGIGEAVRECNGHLSLKGILKILRAVKKPKVVDLALVAVDPSYLNKGVNGSMLVAITEFLEFDGVEYLESNLNLETNHEVMGQWKYFKARQHKRRRSYIKRV